VKSIEKRISALEVRYAARKANIVSGFDLSLLHPREVQELVILLDKTNGPNGAPKSLKNLSHEDRSMLAQLLMKARIAS
jgi:hypothetical protein